MKTLLASLLLTVALFASGCATPTQAQAIATAETGNAVATYILGINGASAIKGLQDLAAALPQIPYGKVSAYQLGQINAELQGIQAQLNANGAAVATSPQNKLLDQVGSLIALVSQATQVGGGTPTIEQGILSANASDVSLGIANAISYYSGSHGLPVSTKPGA